MKFEDRSTSSSSSSTSSGNTTTTTTGFTTHVDKYKEARKTASLALDAAVLPGLTFTLGAAWYEGLGGHTVRLRVRNDANLDSFLEYTLTISSHPRIAPAPF